ncbi:hypothetical protein C2G38_2222032 [Gigaspora rosea]|uniref:Uncharacterized protein n=1 Tax=Gigaspora rosea TaxID=44941 RepID=A0A397U693_9GLOM|nr:hypothetical protein C2G38_2222032 [Gigaspora rosea]
MNEELAERIERQDDGSDSEVKDRNEDEQISDHIVKKKRCHISRAITEFEDEEIKKYL